MKKLRNLSTGENIGGQVSLSAILALVASMEGLSPGQRLAGVLIVTGMIVFMSLWAQRSDPPAKP